MLIVLVVSSVLYKYTDMTWLFYVSQAVLTPVIQFPKRTTAGGSFAAESLCIIWDTQKNL